MHHYIFVYGTLRKGEYNHSLLEGAKYVGTCKVRGKIAVEPATTFPKFRAFDDEIGTGLVTGEVYECDEKLVKFLDDLEVPYGYSRVEVEVESGIVLSGEWITRVEVYEYRASIDTFTQIPSGDWKEWNKHGIRV